MKKSATLLVLLQAISTIGEIHRIALTQSRWSEPEEIDNLPKGGHAVFKRRAYLRTDNWLLYFANIKVGTPFQQAKPITVLFDTGCHYLIVPSVACNSTHCLSKTRTRNQLYDNRHSRTYKKTQWLLKIHFGDFVVEGPRSVETVKVAGKVVKNQGFVEARRVDFPAWVKFSGILGLGNPSPDAPATVIQNMYAQKLVDEPVFSFWLSSVRHSKPAGEVIFGGGDPNLYTGDLKWVDVKKQYGWFFRLDSVTVAGGSDFCTGGCDGFIDSGTSFLLGPTDQVDKIHSDIFDIHKTKSYRVDCQKKSGMPNITWKMNGYEFPLTPEQYVIQSPETKHCFSCFRRNGLIKGWILGVVFMRAYYTQFDIKNHKIGIAPAKEKEN